MNFPPDGVAMNLLAELKTTSHSSPVFIKLLRSQEAISNLASSVMVKDILKQVIINLTVEKSYIHICALYRTTNFYWTFAIIVKMVLSR